MKMQNALIALSSLLTACAYAACTGGGTGRYCNNNLFAAYIDEASPDWRLEWEMFEGSIALTQVGIFWKEYSRASADQICYDTGCAETKEVLRLRRAWHLPYDSATGAYNDARDGNTNLEKQELISVPNPSDRAHDYFAGDVVPF